MALPIITLTPSELAEADKFGRLQYQNALDNNRRPGHGAPVEPLQSVGWHVLGAKGETAVAKWLFPVAWEKVYGIGRADFEGWIDAKTVDRWKKRIMLHKPPHGKQPHDNDWAFVLVHAEHDEFTIRGWVWGREGKQEDFWEDPTGKRPAYFVPHSIMRRPETLVEELRRRQQQQRTRYA